MLSDNEKPNLRPNRCFDAHGKSLGTCDCLRTSWCGSVVCAKLNNNKRYTILNNAFLSEPGLFGIAAPYVDYSLDKQKRWELFDDIVQQNRDDRSSIQPEFQRQRSHSTSTLISQDEHHMEIKSYFSEQFRRRADLPQSMKLVTETRYFDEHTENYYTCIPQTEIANNDIIYSFNVTTRRKPIPSVRTNHRNNMYGNFRAHQRFRLTKEDIYDDIEQSSSDSDEILDPVSICPNFNPIKLNDFPLLESKKFRSQSQRKQRHDNQPSSKKRYNYKGKIYRQYDTTARKHAQQPKPTPRRSRYTSLSYRSVALDRNELDQEYLLKTYGKDFIHAECSPTKYLIYLTNRLKSLISSNESYLVIILNKSDDICYAKVGLNIDLNIEMFELKNLLALEEKVYRIEELIEKVIELLQTLPAQTFKPNNSNSKINQRTFARTAIDYQLNDIEFLNKQIQQVYELNHNNVQNDFVHSTSKTCSICYEDMNDVTSMTALKACGHWLCNNCWTQYLHNSIDYVKLIVCPELHCTSVVDAGTILSLVNRHYLNIYERHIEQCLLNSSRSYVRCPRTKCSNIVIITDSSFLDCIQCRCGYEFCLDCRQDAHFPASCRSTQFYIHIAERRGHLTNDNKKIITTIIGRKCISCNQFIEKNGGCNHMRCRCGVQFCWICTGYWSDHSPSVGIWRCPKPAVSLQERILVGETYTLNNLYTRAIYHRQQRAFHVQIKMKENAKRLIGTIPFSNMQQFDERYVLLEHCYQVVEYLVYLHRICEFASVSALGYCYEPKQFFNSLLQFEMIIYHMEQLFEVGRDYSSIEQFNELYQRSEALIQRLQHAVRLRRNSHRNKSGYITA